MESVFYGFKDKNDIMNKVDIIRKHIGNDDFYDMNGTSMLTNILNAMEEYKEQEVKNCSIPDVNHNMCGEDLNNSESLEMTKEEVIRIGTLMGLSFDERINHKDALKNGRVVFDGFDGQKFLIESSWDDDKIFEKLGQSLISLGKRKKAYEIHRVLSINSD